MFELGATIIILSLMALAYNWGREDGRREAAVDAARWERRGR